MLSMYDYILRYLAWLSQDPMMTDIALCSLAVAIIIVEVYLAEPGDDDFD